MSLGLYLHIPFCVSKCPYCDFYSLTGSDDALRDRYTAALCRELAHWGATVTDRTVDTVYFGGGTPSLLGGARLARLLGQVRASFCLSSSAEITLEANPGDRLDEVFSAFAAAGGNRVSLGMQAADDAALASLGRRHTAADTAAAVRSLTAAGIRNISLDLMLGTPEQTPAAVRRAVDTAADLGAAHVSAYLLKLEPHTPFGIAPPSLPDEDATVALYETAAEALERAGYRQYEISNFARAGYASRHNLKYWNSEPYLGIGPSAHSFYGGHRFAYPRSLDAFLDRPATVPEREDEGSIAENSPEEYAMLRLRLTDGLTESAFAARFGTPIPAVWRARAAALPPSLLCVDREGIRLTRAGFLVSDAILTRLLLG